MAKRTAAEQELSETVNSLPKQVATWSPEQCAEFDEKSDKVMHEQTYGTTPALGQRQ